MVGYGDGSGVSSVTVTEEVRGSVQVSRVEKIVLFGGEGGRSVQGLLPYSTPVLFTHMIEGGNRQGFIESRRRVYLLYATYYIRNRYHFVGNSTAIPEHVGTWGDICALLPWRNYGVCGTQRDVRRGTE